MIPHPMPTDDLTQHVCIDDKQECGEDEAPEHPTKQQTLASSIFPTTINQN